MCGWHYLKAAARSRELELSPAPHKISSVQHETTDPILIKYVWDHLKVNYPFKLNFPHRLINNGGPSQTQNNNKKVQPNSKPPLFLSQFKIPKVSDTVSILLIEDT